MAFTAGVAGEVSRRRHSSIAGQYGPLGEYLVQQAAAGQHQVVLPFAQIEMAILGHPLPHSARRWPSWWQGTGRQPYAWYGWLRAGWFVARVSLATETVTFTRGDDDERG